MKPEKNDDGEWDLDVIDTQYDYFLNAIAKPMSFYSEEYLKSRNTFLVNEWNMLIICITKTEDQIMFQHFLK